MRPLQHQVLVQTHTVIRQVVIVASRLIVLGRAVERGRHADQCHPLAAAIKEGLGHVVA